MTVDNDVLGLEMPRLRKIAIGGIGVAVRDWRVPHVAGAVIFDLAVGDAKARPTADAGYAAARMATADPAEGLVGAAGFASSAQRAEAICAGVGFGCQNRSDNCAAPCDSWQ